MQRARKRVREAREAREVDGDVLEDCAVERANGGVVDIDSSDDEDDEDPAALALRRFVKKRWSSKSWSMKDVTELSFLVTAAGGRGRDDLTVDPTSLGENQARKVRGALSLRERVAQQCIQADIH